MVLVLQQKTRQYFKRFQVKYRRRRSGKTDYRQRLRLTIQDKNKYNTPKYRLVVRFSNKRVTCQIVYATIAGDVTVAAAYSSELPEYGLKVGLTNYSAAYCTGLLLARRVLTKFNMAETYQGYTGEDVGKDYNVEKEGDARPFRCYLDVGLARTSTGAKVFGALKGALDGGLDIPHNLKRFAGYDKDDKKLDEETHAQYIMGGIIGEYAAELQEEEPEKYQRQFKSYVENDIDPEDLTDLYKEVHEKIREDPVKAKKPRVKPAEAKRWKTPKLTYEERKAALKERLNALKEGAGDDE
jgi:large subunit ribosomal protein L5e